MSPQTMAQICAEIVRMYPKVQVDLWIAQLMAIAAGYQVS